MPWEPSVLGIHRYQAIAPSVLVSGVSHRVLPGFTLEKASPTLGSKLTYLAIK